MKKLSLLLIAIVLSIASYSQATFYKVTHTYYRVYENDRWVDEKDHNTMNEDLYAIVDGSKIRFTNNAESSFVTYGSPKENDYGTHTTTTWNAYDKSGRECYLMIKQSSTESTNASILIMYDSQSFEFLIYKN